MGEPTVIAPGGGEIIGDAPDRRVEILSDVDALHATWTRFAPGRDGADLHIHRHHTDLFYVLTGAMTVRLGPDENAIAPAGTLARIPPYVVHGFRNDGEQELRYLNLHAPGCGFADYMRGLRDKRQVDFDQDDPPADGNRPSSDAILGGASVVVDETGLRVVVHTDVDAVTVREVLSDGGSFGVDPRAGQVLSVYVLDGALNGAPAGTWLQFDAPAELRAPGRVRYLEIRTPGG